MRKTLLIPFFGAACLLMMGVSQPQTFSLPGAAINDDALPPAFSDAVAAYRAGDPGAAAAGFLTLAKAGLPQAQFNLALLFRQGEGVPRNHEEALYWAWRARIGGVPRAETLVRDLLRGMGPDQRDALAERLLEDLAPDLTAPPPRAGRAFLASALIQTELRSAPDLMQAYVWFSISAALMTPGAAELRDHAFSGLPSTDQPQAERGAMAAFSDWCKSAAGSYPACQAAGS